MHHAEIAFEQPEYEFLMAEARRLGTDLTGVVRGYVAEHMPAPHVEVSAEEFEEALRSIIGIGASPDDGLTAKDHRRILYGELKP